MKRQLTISKWDARPRSLRATCIATLLPAIALLVSLQSSNAQRLVGTSDGLQPAVAGFNGDLTGDARGVYGDAQSTDGIGVGGIALATSGPAKGVQGQSQSSSGVGVFGITTAITGVNFGVVGENHSTSGIGVRGLALATTGTNYGVYGTAKSPNSAAIVGENSATTGTATGVVGITSSLSGAGVQGVNIATDGLAIGVRGASSSTHGIGVSGFASATTGNNIGVVGNTHSSAGKGVFGLATATTGSTFGMDGQSNSDAGIGVFGTATAATGSTYGVYGASVSPAGVGVYGIATGATGGSNGYPAGVQGYSAHGTGVSGISTDETGVVGSSTNSNGVAGLANSSGAGGYFANGGSGYILEGVATVGGPNMFTVDGGGNGFFAGNLNVTGAITAGTKDFKIDHPLDPANKYLYHTSVESPDMMNVYNGNITTDQNGSATVELPNYFEALNRDFRYQLTVIGQFAQAMVAEEISHNHFTIRTSQPGVKVSWQVTGIRQDAWANAHRTAAEEDKPADQRGTYLHPELYGARADKNTDALVQH